MIYANLNDTKISLALSQKQYKEYIDTHIKNVELAFNEYGEKLCAIADVDIFKLKSNVEVHDRSKYSEQEFDGYRQWFYPAEGERKSKVIFDKAWLHHLRFNKHHPEYWSYADDNNIVHIDPMEPLYVVEMLLDWTAMGMSKGNSSYSYWQTNRDRKPIHMQTILLIDKLIEVLK